MPEFDGKKFQNVAKEGLKLDHGEKSKERQEALEKQYEPLLTWLKENALKDKVSSTEEVLFSKHSLWSSVLASDRKSDHLSASGQLPERLSRQ